MAKLDGSDSVAYNPLDVAKSEAEFRALVQRALKARGTSAIRAALAAGLNRDSIRSVLRGRSPSLGRVAAVCNALGLNLRIDDQPTEAESGVPAYAAPLIDPPTAFTSDLELPVREWETSSPEGHISRQNESGKAPAPVGFDDPAAFYAQTRSQTMTPAGIWASDYALVSPSASIEPPQRVWLQDNQGLQRIMCLIRMTADVYELVGWKPPKPDKNGYQQIFAATCERAEVVDRGAVVNVYRDLPSVTRSTPRGSGWPPRRYTGPERP